MFILLLAILLLLLLAWNTYYRRHWYRQVDVTLDFDRTSVYAGEQVELTEVITNRKKLPLPVLEVGFHTRKELVFQDTENTNVSDYIYKRDIFAVLGRQRITRKIPILCQKRGYYKVEEADITAFSLLYRKRYSQALTTNAAIYVYPAQVNVSETMTVCERMLGIMQCSRHLYEDPFTFRGIREYTTSDPMKTINWKASARRHELMVNVYQDERSQQIYSVIDKGRVMQQAFRGMTLLDYAINASLVLSYVAMRKEDKAGIVTFNEHFDSFVPASKAPGQMQTLLENLYSQQTTFGETDFSSLCVHFNKHVSKRSFLVLYTNFSSMGSMNRQLAYLQQLNRQHRLLVVFFEDADMKTYIASPAKDTEGYYRHVIAEKFAFEKRLIVSTLKQNGIYSLLTTPENLSIDVINKYLEMKSRQLL